jgi:hypothetical protein
MRYLLTAALCCGLALTATAVDEKKTAPPPPDDPVKKEEPKKDDPKKGDVREIDLKDAKVAEKLGAMVNEPTLIKGEEDLKKAVGDDAAKGMKVDFKKEYLALFQWSGSGGDKLSHDLETKDGKTTVTTTLTRGLTKDLRKHAVLIAIPAGAEWKFAK